MCARALIEHGVTHLAIFDVDGIKNAAALNYLSSLGKDEGPHIDIHEVDVTDEVAVNGAIDSVSATFGGIDILLCFAGITGCELAVDYDISRWRKIVDVNLHGSFLVARAVARYDHFFWYQRQRSRI